MSLVEQSRDHVDFIPDNHAVEGQDREATTSYRGSFLEPPQHPPPPTPTITSEHETNMNRFNDDMLSMQNNNDGLLAPALPAKSALRASRLLATMPAKLPTEDRPVLTPAAPHLLYLSSEEDVSSSADDFSDCDYNSDNEDSKQTPQHRTKREDTARMVSVVFYGKPSIVELPRRSISPSSSTEGSVGDLLRTTTAPTLIGRKDSASSTSSLAFNHPPRSSSMITGLDNKKKHHFLNMDPFASRAEPEEPEPQPSSKTATMFKRTLSLVRKRSRPILNPSAAQSRDSLSLQPVPMQQVGEGQQEHHTSIPRAMTPRLPDIVAAARRVSHSAASSPVSETTSPMSPTNRFRTGFMARRRSIRI